MRVRVPGGVLSLVAVLATLLFAEAVLRWVAPARPPQYAPDPRAIYRLRPGAEAAFEVGGQRVVLRVNRDGFRGEDLQRAPRARVVVYGDSFVEARLTPLPQTLPARLAALLEEATGSATEVVNAGVSGYGPDQVALRMEDELPRLRPRAAVLVLFAGNDAGDLVRNALFRLEESRAVPQAWRLDFDTQRRISPPHGWSSLALARAGLRMARVVGQWRKSRDATRGTVDWALLRCTREYEQAMATPGRVGDLFEDHYDADLAVAPSSPSAAYKRALMRGVLQRVAETAAARGVRLLAVIVPSPHDVCPGFPGHPDPARHPEYRASALTDELQSIVAALGIPFVPLYDEFRAGGDRYYLPGDGHWNAAGQDLAARRVAGRLLEGGWSP